MARKISSSKDGEKLAVFFGDMAMDERMLFSDPLILCSAVSGERRVLFGFVQVLSFCLFIQIAT